MSSVGVRRPAGPLALPPFTRFDRLVVGVLLGMIGIIALGVLRGDRVGVRIGRMGPIGEARTSSVVTVQFSEEMERRSVAERFRLEPAVPGDISWGARTMTFRPTRPLEPGATYTVALDSGARGESGREVIAEQRFSFTVLGPRVAFLTPVDGSTKNIWAADPTNPSVAEQLTHSRTGVLAYDVSPNGRELAFAEANETKGSDIKLLDLDTDEVRQLTACGNGVCTDPVWNPDGSKIAFSRQASSLSAIPGVPRDDTRVWLLDPVTSPAKAAPLFPDPQIRGHYNPRWSPDGAWIAVSHPTGASSGSAGVLLHSFATGQNQFFSTTGPAGAFAPDSSTFFFTALAVQEGEMRNTVQRVDLATLEAHVVSPTTVRMNPVQMEWPAAENKLTLAQRAADAGLGQQLFGLDPDGALLPLLVEPNYDHQGFAWKPGGRFVVMERSQIRATNPNDDVRSQVWLYDSETTDLTRIAANAFKPRWLP